MTRSTAFLAGLALAFIPAAITAQDKPVEYVPTKLSDTVTMIQGRGGNIAVSAGDDGVFIIDDMGRQRIPKFGRDRLAFLLGRRDHLAGDRAHGQAVRQPRQRWLLRA